MTEDKRIKDMDALIASLESDNSPPENYPASKIQRKFTADRENGSEKLDKSSSCSSDKNQNNDQDGEDSED